VRSTTTSLHCQIKEAVEWFEPWRNSPEPEFHHFFSLTAMGDKAVLYGGHSKFADAFSIGGARDLFCLRLTA